VKYRRLVFRKRPRNRSLIPTLLLGLAASLAATPAAVPKCPPPHVAIAGIHFASGAPLDDIRGTRDLP
jgi:hypothetical protein